MAEVKIDHQYKSRLAVKKADLIAALTNTIDTYHKEKSKTAKVKTFIKELTELKSSILKDENPDLINVSIISLLNIMLKAKPGKPKIGNKSSTSQRVLDALVRDLEKTNFLVDNEFKLLKKLHECVNNSKKTDEITDLCEIDIKLLHTYLPGGHMFGQLHLTLSVSNFSAYADNFCLFIQTVRENKLIRINAPQPEQRSRSATVASPSDSSKQTFFQRAYHSRSEGSETAFSTNSQPNPKEIASFKKTSL